MKNTPAYILFCLFALLSVWGVAGCRKMDNQKPATVNYRNGKPPGRYSNLKGVWTGIGSASSTGSYTPPDAFDQFEIIVVNDSVVVVRSDTLYYDSTRSTKVLKKFTDRNPHYSNDEIQITYNDTNKSVSLYRYSRASGGSASMYISTALYHPNPSIGTYVNNIVGLKAMSGTLYDTSWFRSPTDSSGPVATSITFTKIDDSTLTFDNDVLGIVGPPSAYNKNHLLHYKLTDSLAKTVVFQNFHLYGVRITTLTYNYETQALTFEQQLRNSEHLTYLKLQ